MTKLYLYTSMLDINDIKLPINIMEHSASYKIKEKRLASMSNYQHLASILLENNLDIASLTFINNKPVIKGLYLSMSHTDGLYGFIISNKEIGLDIEKIIPQKRLTLANKILSSIELEEYNKNDNKRLYLTNKWTIKEAYSKYLGTGLTNDIFKTPISGINLEILGNIIGIYGKCTDLEIYLNNEKI